jgi:hypothetical protein
MKICVETEFSVSIYLDFHYFCNVTSGSAVALSDWTEAPRHFIKKNSYVIIIPLYLFS